MATTLDYEAEAWTSKDKVEALLAQRPTGRIGVFRSVRISTSAGPTDTTLLTVPEGMTLLLYKIRANEGTGYTTVLRDCNGSTGITTSQPVIASFFAIPDENGFVEIDLDTPLIVNHGISIDSTEQGANKTYFMSFQGILV